MGAIRGILKFESSATPQEDLPKFTLELNKCITANKKKKREYSKHTMVICLKNNWNQASRSASMKSL